jgi:hypothetical protein
MSANKRLVEYKENAIEKGIQIYKIEHKIPLKPSHKDGNTNSHPHPWQSSKVRSTKGFGENINQLSLCIIVFHHNVSLLNMVSQELVSPLMVSHSFVEDLVFGYRDGTGVIAH